MSDSFYYKEKKSNSPIRNKHANGTISTPIDYVNIIYETYSLQKKSFT